MVTLKKGSTYLLTQSLRGESANTKSVFCLDLIKWNIGNGGLNRLILKNKKDENSKFIPILMQE